VLVAVEPDGAKHPWKRGWTRVTKLGLPFAVENWLWSLIFRRRRVLVGPITLHWRQLGSRGFRIDPLVKYLNRHSGLFRANVFHQSPDLLRRHADVVVFVKQLHLVTPDLIDHLKKQGTKVVFMIGDNNPVESAWYKNMLAYLQQMDGVIAASPLQLKDIEDLDVAKTMIHAPVINRRYKKNYKRRNPVRIIWQGWWQNASTMEALHPVITQLQRDTGIPVEFVYHTDRPAARFGMIRHETWDVANWEKTLVEADIAVTAKDLDNEVAQRKPATKVLQYMAAGVPTVCRPSAADADVVRHGETGFLVREPGDWYRWLRLLIEDQGLRQRVGRAGRRYALDNYSRQAVGNRYESFFRGLLDD
jgi:hypothetical protein